MLDGDIDAHVLGRLAVNAYELVATADARFFRRSIGKRRDDGEDAVTRTDFHTDALEITRDVFFKKRGVFRRQVDSVRVSI